MFWVMIYSNDDSYDVSDWISDVLSCDVKWTGETKPGKKCLSNLPSIDDYQDDNQAFPG